MRETTDSRNRNRIEKRSQRTPRKPDPFLCVLLGTVFWGTFFGGSALGFIGCHARDTSAPPPSPARVRAVRSCKESFQPTLSAVGTLTYTRKADVYSPQEGIVETLQVEEGDWVEQGQVLATLSKEKLLVAREQARASVACREALLALAEEKLAEGYRAVEGRVLSVEKAEAERDQREAEYRHLSNVLETKKTIFLAGGIPGGDLESIKMQHQKAKTEWQQAERDWAQQRIGLRDEDLRTAGFPIPVSAEERLALLKELGTRTLKAERDVAMGELSIARAELRRVELLLTETEVRSPLRGIVSQRGIEIGEKVTPESLLFTLYEPSSFYSLVEVHEKDVGSLKVGQEAQVRVDALDLSLKGTVHLISPILNPQTRSAHVRVRLDLPGAQRVPPKALLPGMFARITIHLGPAKQGIWVPETALLPEGPTGEGKESVFVVRDTRVFRVPVRVGERKKGKVEVIHGISAGEWVVTHPGNGLREGERVEVME